MIKCIASDMDGTLLNSYQQVSQENIEAILNAQDQGVEVVIATGRSYQEVRYILDEADIHCPVIGVNGAEVRTKEGEILSATPIEKHVAIQAAQRLMEMDIYFEVYTNKGTYSLDPNIAVAIIVDIVVSANPDVKPEDAVKKAQERIQHGLVHQVESYDVLFNDETHQIYKLFGFALDSDRREAAENALEELTELAVSSSGHNNLEITHRNAQKGIALETYVKSKGIDIAETMAMGDSFNDVSMLERVGRAVAMGNADYEIKTLCDVITATNDEHGVAKAIVEVL
ncbi:HAD family hydrolase [Neobacillus niacini]|uniref:HAD family hydrolase n=1 Tax=Neobacillus niacini TaxID=86668 RepID=UPI00203F98E1|nr:HAD family hydrolase [Neobacillus niacini]MCM3694077.1 Cof-type HAD-IIB family hydrolase [Neobacillus niacini]